MAGKEGATNTEGTSPRDGLSDRNLRDVSNAVAECNKDVAHGILFQGITVSAIGQKSSTLGELCKTSDGKILFVMLRSMYSLFGLEYSIRTIYFS